MNMRNKTDDLREKVISALQGEVDSAVYMGHSFKDCVPVKHLVDALSLLKVQEPMKPIENSGFYYCGTCRYVLMTHHQKYCGECGRAVKWDE